MPVTVVLDGLGAGRQQVGGQRGQLAQRAGGVGGVDAVGVLLRGQPPVGHGVAEQRDNLLAVRVGGAQGMGSGAAGHTLKILQPPRCGRRADRRRASSAPGRLSIGPDSAAG
jgi:hypothetical protein